ncbi:uncharacterized protein cubi_00552 [Cryptosporidium ubiquitum]|uniref:Uncharacterized protein n=1 Tax=Cryptosporidium ubiquitum TaxID=857276 RepID=A0A1J4MBZ6_9CRYT|nr:uncharacterized protein cubi_00552 [Cryptosporidium ubiquitum]OII71745.1 hypothetical protein cubi_00552 [Cryptosporidium ubiquitum]
MFELEKLLASYGHPILRERIKYLGKCKYDILDSNNPNIVSFNLFGQENETVFDHDDFVYKLYFSTLKYTEENKKSLTLENKENYPKKGFLTNIKKKSFKDFNLVIEVYNEHIRQLWNDAKQLIEHYRNIASNDIEIYECKNINDCLIIYLPSSSIMEVFSDLNNSNASKNAAFEMITSSIKSCLYCGSLLNTIRYMSFYCSLESKTIAEEINIENYSLIYITLLSNKKIYAFYPDLQIKDKFAILAIEFFDKLIRRNILTNNFVQEISIAINQSEISIFKNQFGFDKISISFSNTLPKSVDEIFSNQKTDINSSDKSFIIFCIPISWLDSTDDYIKLYFAGFITLINNLLLKMIPQCKSTIRCGLRKHVLELTNQEYEGC